MKVSLPRSFFAENLERFRSLLPRGHIAVFFSDPPFRDPMQPVFEAYLERNFYYLSGITETNLCLVVDHDEAKPTIYSMNPGFTEEGFVIKKGECLLSDLLEKMKAGNDKFSFFSYEDDFLNEENKIGLLIKKLHDENERAEFSNCFEILKELRSYKSGEEKACLQRACVQTGIALMETAKRIAPGRYEYEMKAEFRYQLEKRGQELSFQMVASGENSLCLHYLGSSRKLKKNEIVLFDVGSLESYYTSDISRVFSSSLSFTSIQAYVYDLLLEAQKLAESLLWPGNTLNKISLEVKKYIAENLKKENYIEKNEDISLYCPHDVGHPVGLYVHDPGGGEERIVDNGAYALEPGIYLPQYGFGMRVEDCYFIHDAKVSCLSGDIPKRRTELQKYLRKKWPGVVSDTDKSV